MAIEKAVNIKVNTKDAVSETEKLTKAIDSLANAQQEANEQNKKTAEEAKKKIEEQKKATIEARKPLNRLKEGFKSLGTAIKATGVGLLVAGIAKLTMAFSSNAVVSTKLKEVWETINLVFGDFVNSIVTAIQEVGKANGEFDALKKVISSTITSSLTPLKIILGALKISFVSIGQIIDQVQLAWEKSWLGGKGKDKERIKELELSIEEANKTIKETGGSIIKAGKDGFKAFKTLSENIGEAIDEVSEVTSKSIEKVSKISLEESNKQAKALVKLREETRLAIAQNDLILKTKQKEAEIQRQIRDETDNDIATRIKANDELKKILEESNKLQIANAQKAIKLAQAEVKASGGVITGELEKAKAIGGSIDAQEQLIQAQLLYQDVLETTAGFESEQKTNRTALRNEEIELENSRIEAVNERLLNEKNFEAEREQIEILRIEKQFKNLEDERKLIKDDLERKKELYKEGTQARVDAEQEYLTAKQELDQKEITLNKQKTDAEKKQEQDVANAKIGIAKNTLSLIQELAGQGSKVGKALAVAQTTISTIEGVQNAFTTAAKSPITTLFPAYPFIQAGTAGAFGALQVQKILSTNESGGGGGSSANFSGGSAPQTTAPSFNLVQGTGTNQIADTIQNQNRPIKAFVVSNEVTTGQELDRNAVDGATL